MQTLNLVAEGVADLLEREHELTIEGSKCCAMTASTRDPLPCPILPDIPYGYSRAGTIHRTPRYSARL